MANPEWTDPGDWETPKGYAHEFAVGSHVVWPNGVLGKVAAIDPSDDTLMNECGGWHAAYDCGGYIPAEQVRS